jgi:hypothetical protein
MLLWMFGLLTLIIISITISFPQEGGRVVVFYDVEYAYAAPLLEAELRTAGYPPTEVAVSCVDRFYVPAKGLRLPPLRSPSSESVTSASGGGGGCVSCDCQRPQQLPEAVPAEAAGIQGGGDAETVVYGRRVPPADAGRGEDRKRDIVLFVGEEGPTLTNFLITYNQAQVPIVTRERVVRAVGG